MMVVVLDERDRVEEEFVDLVVGLPKCAREEECLPRQRHKALLLLASL
jgi:hypothetical protein